MHRGPETLGCRLIRARAVPRGRTAPGIHNQSRAIEPKRCAEASASGRDQGPKRGRLHKQYTNVLITARMTPIVWMDGPDTSVVIRALDHLRLAVANRFSCPRSDRRIEGVKFRKLFWDVPWGLVIGETPHQLLLMGSETPGHRELDLTVGHALEVAERSTMMPLRAPTSVCSHRTRVSPSAQQILLGRRDSDWAIARKARLFCNARAWDCD